MAFCTICAHDPCTFDIPVTTPRLPLVDTLTARADHAEEYHYAFIGVDIKEVRDLVAYIRELEGRDAR